MKKVGRKVKNRTDTVCTGKSNMKKTALTLILVSTFSHAEQFVIIVDDVDTDKRYVFSALPMTANTNILEARDYGNTLKLFPSATVKNQITYSDFLNETENAKYFVKKMSGWKYIYRTTPKEDWEPQFTYSTLGFESNRFKANDELKRNGFLLNSIKYLVKETTNCPKRDGTTTAKWGIYKLSIPSICLSH